jgi:hypothetical protein
MFEEFESLMKEIEQFKDTAADTGRLATEIAELQKRLGSIEQVNYLRLDQLEGQLRQVEEALSKMGAEVGLKISEGNDQVRKIINTLINLPEAAPDSPKQLDGIKAHKSWGSYKLSEGDYAGLMTLANEALAYRNEIAELKNKL